jgi:chorismate synthase
MGSSFGSLFRITTWGESHGGGVGVVIDGCPPLIPIEEEEVQVELDRRRPGQSKIVTRRAESDSIRFMSGVLDGVTLGTPIMMMVLNEDARSKDYDEMRDKYRPSHADFTYDAKYGIRAWQGGGRASARETIGRVAAGALAKKLLRSRYGVEILAWVEKVHNIRVEVDPLAVTLEQIESNIVRCPDPVVAEDMVKHIEAIRKEGDSVGGVISCIAKGCPAGWGEPVFDKLEAELAKALLSIPACRGFEVGSGFGGTDLKGSQHNDAFYADDNGNVYTPTNRSGGIQGGISNGQPILVKAAFKPTATLLMEQHTVDRQHKNTTLTGRGRHDPCVLPRAVPIVEAMVALVLADHAIRQEALKPRP